MLSGILYLDKFMGGALGCPALFFTIWGCLTRQLFLFGGIK